MHSLILLHGALGTSQSLDKLAQSLSNLFKIYSFDFKGHGGKPFSKAPFTIDTFSHELRDFIVLNQLHGAHVFGYSMGGYVALRMAQTNPDLIGKIFTLGTKFDWNPISSANEAQRLDPLIIQEKVPVYAEKLKRMHAPIDWRELVDKTREMILLLGKHPTLTKTEILEITNDCMIAWGEHDKMVSRLETEWAVNNLHFGKFKELFNTPHELEKTDLDLLAAELVSFF